MNGKERDAVARNEVSGGEWNSLGSSEITCDSIS